MARIRTIKPGFFKHEALFDAEQQSGLPLRLAFAGLWGQCDREGRFPWRPRALKTDVLPYDDVDFGAVLDALRDHGFVVKYEVGGETYGYIPSWGKHQHINLREPASDMPAPAVSDARTCENIPAREEGKGREGKGEGKSATETSSVAPPEEDFEDRGRHKPAPISVDSFQPDLDVATKLGIPSADALLEVNKFRCHHKAKGAVVKNWPAEWELWCNRTVEFRRKDGRMKPADGPVIVDTVWLQQEDPRFALARQTAEARGVKVTPTSSRHESGIGFFFQREWVPKEAA